MKLLVQFVLGCLLVPAIDYIWLGKVMKGFYISELGTLLRLENGEINPILWAAALVYVFISAGILIYVLPLAAGQLSHAFLYGAGLGLVTYGIYDMTNLSTLQNWPVKLSFVDMAWGGFLCGITALILEFVGQKFFPAA